MKHRYLFLNLLSAAVAVAATFQPASARQLSLNEAIDIAAKESNIAMPRASRSADGMQLVHTETLDGVNTLYILNRPQGGYVILAADDVAAPVLAYSESGSYDPADVPPAMIEMLRGYSRDIADASAAGLPEYQASARSVDLPAVAPLLTCKWNQGYPYYNLCPTVGSSYCYTGCVATAVSQVMYYHKWPAKANGLMINSWSYRDPSTGQTTSATKIFNGNTTPFDWENMLDTYSTDPAVARQYQTEAQETAVANLMYAVGCGIGAKWNPSGTSASLTSLLSTLLTKMYYDNSLCMVRRQYFTTDEWLQLLYNEFTTNGPVIFDGSNASTEHCFVADGYDGDGRIHINWGWSGMSDGYFSCEALNPTAQGAGGSAGGYSSGLKAIIGIRPAVAGSQNAAYICITGSFKPDATTYGRSETIDFIGTGSKITAQSGTGVKYTPGIKLVAENGDVSYIWSTLGAYTSNATDQGPSDLLCNAADFPTSGTYIVTPVAEFNGEIVDMKVTVGCVNTLTLMATESELTFKAPEDGLPVISVTALTPQGKFYEAHTSCYEISVTNTGGSEYYGSIQPMLYDASNAAVSQMRTQMISILPGETKTLTWSEQFAFSIAAGSYTLGFVDSNGNRLDNNSFGVSILPSVTPSLALTGLDFTNSVGQTSVSGVAATTVPRTFDTHLMLKSPNYSGTLIIYQYIYDYNDPTKRVSLGSKSFISEEGTSVPLDFTGTIPEDFADGSLVTLRLYYYDGTGSTMPELRDESNNYARYTLYIDPQSGITTVDSDATDLPVEYYNLQGIRVDNPTHGVYILRQGNTVRKVIL